MVVPAVDLLYVFGRYLVLSDHVTLMISSVGTTVVSHCLYSTEEGSSAML